MKERQFHYQDKILAMEQGRDDFTKNNERLLDVLGWTQTEATTFSIFIEGLN